MGLESTTNIDGLVITNPVGGTDPKSQGDDHIRLLKDVLKQTFPGYAGAHLRQVVKSSGFTAANTDNGTIFKCSGTWTLEPPAPGGLSAGWTIYVWNSGAGTITIDPTGSVPINGNLTITVPAGWVAMVTTDPAVVGFKAAFFPIDYSDIPLRSGLNLFTDLNIFEVNGQPGRLENLELDATVASGTLTVKAFTKKNAAAPSTSDPILITFRDDSATDGGYITAKLTAATEVAAPGGASLGFTDDQVSFIEVYAIYDSGGTVRLGLRHPYDDGVRLSEFDTHNATLIDATSDSRNTMYATAAHTSRFVCYLGRIKIQRGTGTWSNAPTEVIQTSPEGGRTISMPAGKRVAVIDSTQSFVAPRAGTYLVILRAGGGGGGKGATCGVDEAGTGGVGGQEGERKYGLLTLTEGQSETVTIGAGGAGSTGTGGAAGGNTTFGALLTALGGVGGVDGIDVGSVGIQQAGHPGQGRGKGAGGAGSAASTSPSSGSVGTAGQAIIIW